MTATRAQTLIARFSQTHAGTETFLKKLLYWFSRKFDKWLSSRY